MFKRQTLNRKRASIFAVFFAMMLSLVTITNTFAANLTNGDFHYNHPIHHLPICSLHNWVNNDGSSVQAGSESLSGLGISSSSDCVGKLEIPAGYLTQSEISRTLSQTFTVPTSGSKVLSFYVWAKSNAGINPSGGATEPTYRNQVISIYNAQGQVIMSEGHSYNAYGTGVFVYDLAAYAGQDVTLELKVRKSTAYNTPSHWVKLYADNVQWGAVTVPFGTSGTFDW
jgi:hypothetical protein